MTRLLKLALSSLFLLFTLPVESLAATVSGLYETETPIYGSDKQARDDAMRRALVDVLVRVSGNRDVSLAPGIPAALKNPAGFAQQFRYQKPSPETLRFLDPRPSQMLWVSFDSAAVNRTLQNNGLPIWGQSRPSLLVWLLVEDGGERRFVDAQSPSPLRDQIEYAGNRRGVPLVLPLLDSRERGQVKVQDVWAGFLDELQTASKRYSAEAILVGRVSALTAGAWHGRWSLLHSDQPPVVWENDSGQVNALLADAMDAGSDALARRYAQFIEQGSEDALLLRVSELKTLQDYARVQQYLTSLAPVSELLPVQVRNGQMVFRLRYKGSRDGLTRAIQLGRVLQPMEIPPAPPVVATAEQSLQPQPAPTDQETVQLAYRLMP